MDNEIIEILEHILEEDGLTETFKFDEESWDSLNIISFIASINSKYSIVLDAGKTAEVSTVSDLIILVESEK